LFPPFQGRPLYSGDQIAMRGGEDPDNRRDFPGGFPGSTTDAFSRAGRRGDAETLFDWIAQLAALGREHPALGSGVEQVLKADKDTFVTLRYGLSGCTGDRSTADERIIVALHRGKSSRVHVDLHDTDASAAKPRASGRTTLPLI
jgi:glycosidase